MNLEIYCDCTVIHGVAREVMARSSLHLCRLHPQVNERQLQWDDAAARQLIKLVLMDKLRLVRLYRLHAYPM